MPLSRPTEASAPSSVIRLRLHISDCPETKRADSGRAGVRRTVAEQTRVQRTEREDTGCVCLNVDAITTYHRCYKQFNSNRNSKQRIMAVILYNMRLADTLTLQLTLSETSVRAIGGGSRIFEWRGHRSRGNGVWRRDVPILNGVGTGVGAMQR